MKCAEYEEALEAMRGGFRANKEIFLEVSELIRSVNSSFDTFLGVIPKIDISLPTKRRRSSLFRKLSGMVEFPNAEKRFTELWKWIFSTLSGLPTFGGVLTTQFLPIFNEIWRAYETTFHEIEERIVSAVKAVRAEEQNYRDSYAKYQQFCRTLEAKRNHSDLNTLKTSYPHVVQTVVSNLEKYNEKQLECGKVVEYCLLDFENADKTRSEAINALFVDLVTSLSEYRQQNKDVVEDLRQKVGGVSSVNDVEDSIDSLGQEQRPVTIDLHLPGFDFNVTEFVNAEEVFLQERKKWKGRMTNGDVVTVIDDSSDEYQAETASGNIITVQPSNIEKIFDRKLATMNEEFSVLNKGETVLVIDQSETTACVMNVFYDIFDVDTSIVTIK